MIHTKRSASRCAWKMLLIASGFLLTLFLSGCGANTPASPTQPDISWTTVDSPLFPRQWPPTADTVWVRYTFAYGMNPSQLMDGSAVSAPLSITEWQAGNSSTKVLSGEMQQAGIQGLVPLDDETRLLFETGSQVSDFCLTLTGLPDPGAPATQNLLAYYRAWFEHNGVFLDLIREDHADFITWVGQHQGPASSPSHAPQAVLSARFTNSKYGYSLEYPGTLDVKLVSDEFVEIGDHLVVEVFTTDPAAPRGDGLFIENSTEVQVAGRPATLSTGYLGSVGGYVPQQFKRVVFEQDGVFFSLTLYALGLHATGGDVTEIVPLDPDDVSLFDEMAASFEAP